jgi:hypothetical protein
MGLFDRFAEAAGTSVCEACGNKNVKTDLVCDHPGHEAVPCTPYKKWLCQNTTCPQYALDREWSMQEAMMVHNG